MSPPTVPEQPVPVLDLVALTKLLKACAGNTFENRRDTAIIRLFLETGMRAGELAGLSLDDVDREQSMAFVMGKGGRGRACPYGSRAADSLRRYLRERTRHPLGARTERLWIGKTGPMTDSGVRQMLERRCADAGIPAIHPHQFRHTFAHLWLANGGQESYWACLIVPAHAVRKGDLYAKPKPCPLQPGHKARSPKRSLSERNECVKPTSVSGSRPEALTQ